MFPKNAVNWVEIPASDLARAQAFYEAAFALQLIPVDFPNLQMRMFPTTDEQGIGGAIVYAPDFYQPSLQGTLVYLNGNPDLQAVLDRIPGAGGKVLMPKTEISPEYGFMALFEDSEGNRVGLHCSPVAS